MIVDLRIYTVRPGKLAAFVALYRDYAWALQTKHLGTCVGWYTVVEGSLNQVVHLWQYESQADREARRAAMADDPAWGEYIRRSDEAGYLVAQENRLLRPTEFFAGR